MSRPAERVVAFYNKRGTCEQWIKEGKGAITLSGGFSSLRKRRFRQGLARASRRAYAISEIAAFSTFTGGSGQYSWRRGLTVGSPFGRGVHHRAFAVVIPLICTC